MTTFRTHTGFVVTRPAEAGADYQFYGNPLMNQLYLELINKPELTATWEWQRKAIKAIAQLFHDNRSFFKTQIYGGAPLAPRMIDFLHSTLTFIMSGKRKLSVELWSDLLDYHPTDLALVGDKTKDHFMTCFGPLMTFPETKLIAMWISQPGGLHDLVVSAHLIFGNLPENWQEV